VGTEDEAPQGDTPSPAEPTAPAVEIPVLHDRVDALPESAEEEPEDEEPASLRGLGSLPRPVRIALATEAAYVLDELMDEALPFLEARLRERLEKRLQELLGQPDENQA